MARSGVLLSDDDRALLITVQRLLEAVLETQEIVADSKTVNAIRDAEKDVREGRTREYQVFRKELKDTGDL